MASNPTEPPHLPGAPPVVDEFEARIMREESQHPPLLPKHGTHRGLHVVAGRNAGKFAGTAVNTVTQLRRQVPALKQRTQGFVQDSSQRVREYANAKPVNAILMAAGAGFILGFLLRMGRRRRE
jgi:ElaB/YqjD/DUF883 family membrane-anchored ribosome-binding protein